MGSLLSKSALTGLSGNFTFPLFVLGAGAYSSESSLLSLSSPEVLVSVLSKFRGVPTALYSLKASCSCLWKESCAGGYC